MSWKIRLKKEAFLCDSQILYKVFTNMYIWQIFLQILTLWGIPWGLGELTQCSSGLRHYLLLLCILIAQFTSLPLELDRFSAWLYVKKDSSENEADSHDTSSEPWNKSTDIQKLQNTVNMVKPWQKVREKIKKRIDGPLSSRRHDFNECSRKIQPLFLHRGKHSKNKGKLSIIKTGGSSQRKSFG